MKITRSVLSMVEDSHVGCWVAGRAFDARSSLTMELTSLTDSFPID